MGIQDNSPTRTNIRWSNIKILHEGMIYVIKDGATSNKYVYWKLDNPNDFFTCDILPDSHIQTVMMNNEGVAHLYPSANLLIDDNAHSVINNNVLVNHISNSDVHMSQDEKKQIDDNTNGIVGLITSTNDIYDEIIALKNTLAALTNKIRNLEIDNTAEHASFNDRISSLESK